MGHKWTRINLCLQDVNIFMRSMNIGVNFKHDEEQLREEYKLADMRQENRKDPKAIIIKPLAILVNHSIKSKLVIVQVLLLYKYLNTFFKIIYVR
jgi:hypothetical protein